MGDRLCCLCHHAGRCDLTWVVFTSFAEPGFVVFPPSLPRYQRASWARVLSSALCTPELRHSRAQHIIPALCYPCRAQKGARAQARGDTRQVRHRPGHPSKTSSRFYPCQDQCCRLGTQGWCPSFCPGDREKTCTWLCSISRAPGSPLGQNTAGLVLPKNCATIARLTEPLAAALRGSRAPFSSAQSLAVSAGLGIPKQEPSSHVPAGGPMPTSPLLSLQHPNGQQRWAALTHPW